MAALIKGKKFKKRDARIYSKLEEYNIDQNNNNKNLFKSPWGSEYILQPKDKTADRTCSTCLEIKPSEVFKSGTGSNDAYQCVDCHRTINQQRYENRPEEYKIELLAQIPLIEKSADQELHTSTLINASFSDLADKIIKLLKELKSKKVDSIPQTNVTK